MTTPKPPVQIVEELADTTALILDSDYPFLADTLTEKLINTGCDVDRNPQILRTYDYIIVLGTPRKFLTTIKKRPHEFPYAKLLKSRGKAIIVASNAVDFAHKHPLPVTFFVLDASRTFSAEALSDKILRALFTSKSLHRKIPAQKTTISQINRDKDGEAKPHSIKNRIRLALVIATITLFLSPLLIYATTLSSSVYWISQSIDEDIPLANRQKIIKRATQSGSIAHTSGAFLKSIISPFSPTIGKSIESNSELVYFLSQAISEGLTVEESIKQKFEMVFRDGKSEDFSREIPVIQNSLAAIESHLDRAVEASKTMTSLEGVPIFKNYYPLTSKLEEARSLAGQSREAVAIIPNILAFEGEKKYLLLFQNNFELRPTGGFIGSFGILTVNRGTLSHITVEDVYEADGQLKGVVTPPDPIRVHLNQPNWFLRDSNWNPDFSVSAQQAEWFLEKELGKTVDGVIAVDLYFVKNLLDTLDGVYVPGYQARVTGDDFFLKLQSDTHDNFFPGSNEKKNLLSSLLTAMTIELTERKTLPYPQLARSITGSLSRKHILMYFHDQKAQDVTERLGWAGALITPPDQSSSFAPIVLDYTMAVEANLGVNKVNYHIKRELINTVTATETTINRDITIYYKNSSPKNAGLYTGTYKNYLRIVLPQNADLSSVQVGNRELSLSEDVATERIAEKKIVGFLVEVPEQQELKAIIKYALPIPVSKSFAYYLIMQKQPGTDRDPFVFKTGKSAIWNVTTSTIPSLPYLSDLSTDRLLSLDFTRQVE